MKLALSDKLDWDVFLVIFRWESYANEKAFLRYVGECIATQSSVRQNGLLFSPRHRKTRVALVKANENKANPETDDVCIENGNQSYMEYQVLAGYNGFDHFFERSSINEANLVTMVISSLKAMIVGSLPKAVFEARTLTGSESFFLLICLDANFCIV